MEPSLLTQRFDRLEIKDRDIRALYESLSKQQIRELKSLIKSTDFRFDIVANLPVELISLIFQYLELYQLFQCRRVSRQWLGLLGADEVVKPILQPWIATEDVRLRIPEGLSSKSILNIYAEHQDAFQTGNAFGRFQMPHRPRHGQIFPQNLAFFSHAYSDGLLAWVSLTGGSDMIYLRALESGDELTFMPPERDEIYNIVLSQTLLVAMTTSARYYIWAHRTMRPPFVLRTPSRCQNVFHLSKSSFILMRIQPNSSEALAYQSVPVITWKLRDSWQNQPPEQPPQAIVSQFSIRILSGFSRHDVYVDRREQHIVYLESTVVKEKRTHTLRVLHLSFGGKTLFEESLDCSFAEIVSAKAHENHPLQNETFFDVWVVTHDHVHHDPQKHDRHGLQETGVTHLRYNLDRKVFRILDRKKLSHSHQMSSGSMMKIFPWKGIAYFEEPSGDHAAEEFQYRLRVMNFREETCVEARYVAPQEFGSSGSLDKARLFFGDEVFLIKITSTDLIVWCFDKHLRMAGEDEKFKEERRLFQSRRLMDSA
ncbi:MAG: hypothetical protein Q9195_000216 [Heterodermia aff. obscurata]